MSTFSLGVSRCLGVSTFSLGVSRVCLCVSTFSLRARGFVCDCVCVCAWFVCSTKLNLFLCTSISGSGFACLSSLTSLQELDLRHNHTNDKGLAGLSRSPVLTRLNLFRCALISSAGFACLSSLTSLQELNVRHTTINAEGLAKLSRALPALSKVEVVGSTDPARLEGPWGL